MTRIVFFLEERSAKEMLEGLLPRLLPEGVDYLCIPFSGKQDLEKQLFLKLRGWIYPDDRFVILRDQDQSDWREVKQRLREICDRAGKHEAIIRIARTELESWYLGDLLAVESALGIRGLAERYQNKERFRDPDAFPNAAQELKKITRGSYQKINGSRRIGSVLDIRSNRSCSFQVFLKGIGRAIQQ